MLGSHLPAALGTGHHRRHLIVKLRRSARDTLSAGAGSAPMAAAPGLAALAAHAAADRLRRLVPLHRRHALAAGTHPAHAMAALAASAHHDGVGAGVIMVELTHDAHTDALHRDLTRDPHVEYVARVPARYLLGAAPPAATPPPAAKLWNLARIGWDQARARPGFRDAAGVRVAVADTGVEPTHPDLVHSIGAYVYAHPDLAAEHAHDPMGHGTHVSGIIAARTAGKVGATGMCRADVRLWKIFADEATYDDTINLFVYGLDPVMYRRALAECLDEKVQVLNLSLGGVEPPDPHERHLYDALLASGTTLVAAMGNARQQGNPVMYPAALPHVVAVGAVDRQDTVGSFSSSGPHIAVVAPGVDIWSTLPTYPGQLYFDAAKGPRGPVEGKPVPRETRYGAWFGTSMAAPQVTAAAALLLAHAGAMSGADVRRRLMDTADRVPGMKGAAFTPDYGAGRINLLRLLGG